MSKILMVGTDCSECSERAIEYAAEWAGSAQLRLVVVHVIEWSPYSFTTAQENEERHMRREAELDRAHKEIVDPVVERLGKRGLDVTGIVRHGHAAATLCAVAEECGATHIVIGRTGASRIRAQLFGSVANSLIQISTHPVTVVP
jgi:nucleotide-binding universal stress UspA family protein